MVRRKTLFKKYLSVIMLIVFFSFLALGSMLWIFISNYWENEKRELLTKNAIVVSDLVSQNSGITMENKIHIDNNAIMQGFVDTFSNNINADIFITDLNGDIIICSNNDNYKHLTYKVPESIVNKIISEGNFNSISDLGQIYKDKCFTVGVPVYKGTSIISIVFTAVDYQYLNAFRLDIFKMFLWAMLIVIILSLIAIGFLSYTLIKPMRQMAMAAQSFGNGDFSQRVPVNSEDEMGQLSIAFNNMADSLSASEDTRRNFIANVSHELRTPMTTISGFVDGILDGTITKDKQDYYLRIVSNETKRLSRLVRTMLNLSRIDSNTVHLNKTSFDLLSLVINILISFEETIYLKQLNITGLDKTEGVFVFGDMDMIYQAVYNLIENAIKFVNEKGYIDISVKSQNEKAIFKIKNSGQGIKQSDINHVFDRFYKTDRSRSKDKNGMGLGLYIVKQIIRLHNGEIYVNSKENVYTEFTFFIPDKKNKKM